MNLLSSLLPVFVSTILPVFLVAGAGYVLASFIRLDARSLGRMLFYLFSPALIFRSLYKADIDLLALGHVVIVVVGVMLAGMLLGWLAGAGQDRQHRAGMMLASAFSNNGNMGIPVNLFAFGEAGVALATLYYAVNAFLSNTVGVVVASSGSAPLLQALAHSLRSPVLYAAILGLGFNLGHVTVPDFLFRAIDLMAGAAVPGMLVLLGLQLRATPISRDQTIVWRPVVITLVASPLVAWGLCQLLGVTGVERQALILQAAMPTAVMTTVLATEFTAAPKLVAAAVFVSTLASMLTLAVVLLLIT